jgi:hypothetical protein
MNCERLQIAALRTAMLSCILFTVPPIGLFAQTATIHVRVLDGRTGKNLSGMNLAFVDYHTDREGGTHADLNGRMTVKTSMDDTMYSAKAIRRRYGDIRKRTSLSGFYNRRFRLSG